MNRFFIIALPLALAALPSMGTTLTFAGFPDSTILTNQHPGVTFTNAIVLTAGISLNQFEFPPYTGTNVLSDKDGPITVSFATPENSFGGYFTYGQRLIIDAFNSADTLLATTTSMFSNNEALLGPRAVLRTNLTL
jgi:hypothetical protein